MPDSLVDRQGAALPVARLLMDVYCHTAVFDRDDGLGGNAGVDALELPRPVGAYRVDPMDVPALEAVGPDDVLGQCGMGASVRSYSCARGGQ